MASTFAKNLYPMAGTTHHRTIHLHGRVPLTTSGDLATTYAVGTMTPGVTVAHSTTGTYTLTLSGAVTNLVSFSACIIGAHGAGGYTPVISVESPTTGVFTLTWVKGSTDAVAEIANSLAFTYHMVVSVSSVAP
jgi:hypothetical protein